MKNLKIVFIAIIYLFFSNKCNAVPPTIISNQTKIICNIKYELDGEIIKINLCQGESVIIDNDLRNLKCYFYTSLFFPKIFCYPWTNGIYNFIENEDGDISEAKYQEILDADPTSWCSIQ